MRGRAAFCALSALALATPAVASREEAQRPLRAGVEAYRAGDPRTARIELLNAAKADPVWSVTPAMQARVYLELGDWQGARSAVDQAVRLGYPESRLRHLQALALLGMGDAVAAEALAARVPPASPAAAEAARTIAKAAQLRGDFGAASAAFNRALALTPRSPVLWTEIGRFRRATGNQAGAIEASIHAASLDPDDGEALLFRAEMVRSQYGLEAAIPWFQQAIDARPQHIPALVELAATLGDAGRTREMLATTRQILSLEPGNPQAYYLQAVLAARAGRFGLARGLLNRAGGRLGNVPGPELLRAVIELEGGANAQAAARLSRLVDRQPFNLRFRRLAALALLRKGDALAAFRVLQPVAVRADADSYALVQMARVHEALEERSPAAHYLGRASKPSETVSEPFKGDFPLSDGAPGSADFVVPRLRRMLFEGSSQTALAEAQALAAQNPGAPAAHVLAGDVLMSMGRFREATEAFRRAANIRFDEPIALRTAEALRASGDGAAALAVLNLYLGQNPASVPATQLAAQEMMATRRWNAAAMLYESIRQRTGNNDSATLSNLSWAMFNLGDQANAALFGRRAFALAPANPVVSASYGWFLAQRADSRKHGLVLLKKAVAQAPGEPRIRYQYGRALALAGDRGRARAELTAAVAGPPFPERDQARALLKTL